MHHNTYLDFHSKIARTKTEFVWQYSISADVQQRSYQASIPDACGDVQRGIAVFVLKIDDRPKVAALVLCYPHKYLIEVISGAKCTALYACKVHDVMQDRFSGGVKGAYRLIQCLDDDIECLLV